MKSSYYSIQQTDIFVACVFLEVYLVSAGHSVLPTPATVSCECWTPRGTSTDGKEQGKEHSLMPPRSLLAPFRVCHLSLGHSHSYFSPQAAGSCCHYSF